MCRGLFGFVKAFVGMAGGSEFCDAKYADYCVMTRDHVLLGMQMAVFRETCRICILREMETRGLLENSVHID